MRTNERQTLLTLVEGIQASTQDLLTIARELNYRNTHSIALKLTAGDLDNRVEKLIHNLQESD